MVYLRRIAPIRLLGDLPVTLEATSARRLVIWPCLERVVAAIAMNVEV
jgi:hypothetical protein